MTPLISIHLAEEADVADAVVCLDGAAGTEALRVKLAQLIREHHLWIAKDEAGKIIGTLGFDETRCRRSLFVQMLGAHPCARRSGVGSALYRHSVRFARSRGLRRLIAQIPTGASTIAGVLTGWGFRRDDRFTSRCAPRALEFWILRLREASSEDDEGRGDP